MVPAWHEIQPQTLMTRSPLTFPSPRPFTFARMSTTRFGGLCPKGAKQSVDSEDRCLDLRKTAWWCLMPGSCRSLLCGLTNSLHRTIHVLQLHPFELKPPACPRIAVRGNWIASGDLDSASIDMEQQRMKNHRRLADDASLARVDCSKRITVAKMASIRTCVARNIMQLVRSCHIEFAFQREHYGTRNAWNMFWVKEGGRWHVSIL